MFADALRTVIATIPLPAWLPDWTRTLAAPLAAVLLWAIISRLIPLLVQRERRTSARLLLNRTRLPIQLALVTLLVDVTLRAWIDDPALLAPLDRIVPILMVIAFSILVYRAIGTLFVAVRRRYNVNTPDNLKARRAMTQILVLERVVGFSIVVVALGVALMTIPEVRTYGTSLLASAGVAGLVIGLAAQQTLGNVLAGIQIAITQPLRIEDAVVIDGEWGWVEEITLTYIVVRVWDRRRLVVPISYLLQKPFQNWTRTSASVIGSVVLHLDYTADLDALRVEQTRLLASAPEWDSDVDVMQVIDTTETTMVVRSLMTAPDSPRAWDLRCRVREGLLDWLRRHSPDALPRQRMRLQGSITQRADGSSTPNTPPMG